MVLEWTKPAVITVDTDTINVPAVRVPFTFLITLNGPTGGDEVYFNIPQEAWDLTGELPFRSSLLGATLAPGAARQWPPGPSS
jgi:hypothetical protein